MTHDEEKHEEVQRDERRGERRVAKKRRRMRVSGKSVFVLRTLWKRGPKSSRSRRRTIRRRS
ncbi:MAG: hypothetical protein Q8R32_01775 [bacterium]|nr:hypothetical protein [bacterium]